MKLENKPMSPIIAGQQVYNIGLSTRDYTAIMAMQGLISCAPCNIYETYYQSQFAEWAYSMADEMMKAGDLK